MITQSTIPTNSNYTPLTCSEREIQIIKLISLENTTRDISNKLFISESTVDTHRRRIFIKLGVKNSAGMVRRAFELGIISIGMHGKDLTNRQAKS